VSDPIDLEEIASRLRAAGCVAAEEEAAELSEAAGGDPGALQALVGRRCQGEPLAWLIGSVLFCGARVAVHDGVYVPRWQSEPMALEAVARLPAEGTAVDLCTGSGAIALVMAQQRPSARVLATEIDPVARACAESNGVEVYLGDLTAALPADSGEIDVVVGVLPYVPTNQMRFLPRDVREYEAPRALDGGDRGTDVLVRAITDVASLLRPGGSLLLEIGGEQDVHLAPVLAANGYQDLEWVFDDDDDLRAVYCRRPAG
jgi:release factor glutamine methyltransferase